MQVYAISELGALLLQVTVTMGLGGLFLYLYTRHRRAHFGWWSAAMLLYGVALLAVVSFLLSGRWGFLYWHQVLIGWTALLFLHAASVFSRQVVWKNRYLVWALFPVAWSYVAIFVLDQFALAAGPAVAFLSLTTIWTGVVFWRYRVKTGSSAALFLAVVLLLWGLHHLDYPWLRARGAWNPWGYYVDTLFILAMGAGILLLVIEEVKEGLTTLAALSGDVRRPDTADWRDGLLRRPLELRGVTGSALLETTDAGIRVVRGVGAAANWEQAGMPAQFAGLVKDALGAGRSRLEPSHESIAAAPPFAAVLPLGGGHHGTDQALVVIGDLAAPFAALDESILTAIGEQIGAGLEHAELYRSVAQRTADLERLSTRMITDHEDQRRRLGRELHDETAQVFSALKLQLGTLREAAPAELGPRFDRLVDLVDVGTRSIRSVTEDLRPAVLEDLGLVPALRALVSDFQEWSAVVVDFAADLGSTRPSAETELALFRATQEALSNVARHARATQVIVRLGLVGDRILATIADNGAGLSPPDRLRLATGPGRSGLFGLRERIAALGGSVRLDEAESGGLVVETSVPVEHSA